MPVLATLGERRCLRRREEKSQLGGFFQRDYTSNKTITISADLMKKCLESSKFAGLTWELILETYFGEPLQVKKEIELAESKRREDYFAEILESISDESGRECQRIIRYFIFQNPCLIIDSVFILCSGKSFLF